MSPDELRSARIKGALSFALWLLDNGHLDHKSEDDKNLVRLFIRENWEDLRRAPTSPEDDYNIKPVIS